MIANDSPGEAEMLTYSAHGKTVFHRDGNADEGFGPFVSQKMH